MSGAEDDVVSNDVAANSLVPVALIGVGAIGRGYADAVAVSDQFELVAAVDASVDRARGVLGGLDPAAFASVHDLLDHADNLGVRAAIVCAPTTSHVPVVTALLERGVAVLCHPPLAPSRPSTRMILDCARRTKSALVVASDHRRAYEVEKAATMLASGVVGDVRLVRVHLRTQDAAETGILRELGTVALDLVRMLVGPIRHVTAEAADVSDARTTTSQFLVRTDDDISVSVMLSADCSLGPGWDVLAEGSQGALRLDAEGLSRHAGVGWEKVCRKTPVAELRSRHLERLADALCSGQGCSPTDEDDALAAVAVLEAARRSVEIGGWARVIDERVSAGR